MEQAVEQQQTIVSWRPVRKIIFFCIWLLIFSLPAIYLINNIFFSGDSKPQKVLFKAPMKQINYSGLGQVSEPSINLKLQTQEGFENHDFLIDSGAVISSLPYEMAEKLGQNLLNLPRIAIGGYGNNTTFAYQGNMTLKLEEAEIFLPVVFSGVENTKFLLGRKGFFDKYSLVFDHKNNTIEIKN